MTLEPHYSSRVFYGQMADLDLLSMLFNRPVQGAQVNIEDHALVYQTIDQVRGFMHPILLKKWGSGFRSWGITHREGHTVPALLVRGLNEQDLFVYRDWEGINIEDPESGWFREKFIRVRASLDDLRVTTETFQPSHTWHKPERAHFDNDGMPRFWLPRDEVFLHAQKIGAEKRIEFMSKKG